MFSFIKRVWNFIFGEKETFVEKPETVELVTVKEIKVVEKEHENVELVTVKEIKSAVKKPKVKKEPKFKASKAAIKLAKENSIDLTKVTGTGKEGNITVTDIKNIIK